MIKLEIDTSEVADFIGRAEGLTEVIRTPIYLDDILRIGHFKAAEQFDIDAAAYATASQKLNHMYEWGTQGINEAPGMPLLPPTSPSAMLWRHKMTGGQTAEKGIEFDFRASRVPVPLPTPETTGIQEEYMTGNRKPSRRHIFYWKAPIMEFGIPVTIKPVYSQALWIPLKGNPMTQDTRAIKRDYIMTKKTVRMVPGQQFMGQFTKFWMTWWGGLGMGLINMAAQTGVDTDTATVMDEAGKMRGVRLYSGGAQQRAFSLKVKSSRAQAKAMLLARTKGRRAEAAVSRNMQTMPGGKWNK